VNTSAHDFSKLHGRTSNGEDLVGMDCGVLQLAA